MAVLQTSHAGTGQTTLSNGDDIDGKPKKEATVFDKRHSSFGDGMIKNGWIMPPLLSGEWEEVGNPRAQKLINEFIAKAESKYPGVVRNISRLRALPLLFYPDTYLFEGMATIASGQKGLILFIKHGREIIQLTGTSDIIHKINKDFGIQLDTKEKVSQYLRLFCAALLQADLGPFLIVESLNELRLSHNISDILDRLSNLDIRSLNIASNDKKKEWKVSGNNVHGKELFLSEFTIKHDGNVSMENNVTIKYKFPVRQISYENGVVLELPKNKLVVIPCENKEYAENIDEVKRLGQQVIRLYVQGNYREAAKLGERVLAIQEKNLDSEHPHTALSLNNLAELYSFCTKIPKRNNYSSLCMG